MEEKERIMKWIAGDIALSGNPGETIKRWRERFDVNQTELAKAIRVSPSVVSDYEASRRKSPGATTIKRITEALLKLDEERGGEVSRTFSHAFGTQLPPDVVLEIREYRQPVDGKAVAKAVNGEVVSGKEFMEQKLFGYTAIDSYKAIISMSPEDFRRIYGMTTERVLAFTGVTAGRSPMVAIRVIGITPGMVVLHGDLKEVDPLGIKIAQLLKVPLVISRLPTVVDLISNLRKCSP
ncbi:MAG: helix-turn-helix domain-containing protein [Candidatus Hadarchaeota archaeon]